MKSAVQLSAAIAVLTTGIIAFTAGTALQNLNQGSAVEVNSQDFTWWKNTHFAFEKVLVATPLVFPAEPMIVNQAPVVRVVRHIRRPHLARKSALVERDVKSVVVAQEEIQKLFVGPLQPVAIPRDEKLIMQSLHGLLTTRFHVAMNSQTPLTIQTAAIAPIQVPTQVQAVELPRATPIKKHTVHSVRALPVLLSPVTPVLAPDLTMTKVARAVAVPETTSTHSLLKDKDSDSIRITRAEPVPAQAPLEAGVAEVLQTKPTNQPEPAQLPSTLAMTSAPESIPATTEDVSTQISAQIQKFNALGVMATQPQSPVEYPQVTTQVPVAPPQTLGNNAVEAFSQDQIFLMATKILLSSEGQASGSQAKWWELQEKQSHWSTLISLRDEDQVLAPLISNNTAMTLASAAHVELQADAGIIFGKIPAGWEIDLSGRAERPVFFDEDFKSITAATTDKVRNFALINVAPGMPLLYVTAVGGSKSAALAVPVKPGMATYVNVPVPTHQSMSGRVFDASSSAPHGLAGISVSVVGQDGLTAISNDKGFFRIADVLVFGEQSLYLDVKPDDKSFIHRYRVSSSALKNLSLFYFNESTIDFLLKQMDGGVSPAGGLVIGAFPETVAKAGSQILFPNISPMLKNQTLTSEAYTLSETNRLLPRTALTSESPRFLDLQVPEGANIASLNSDPSSLSTAASAWSELVISQQGVICVVGPY